MYEQIFMQCDEVQIYKLNYIPTRMDMVGETYSITKLHIDLADVKKPSHGNSGESTDP